MLSQLLALTILSLGAVVTLASPISNGNHGKCLLPLLSPRLLLTCLDFTENHPEIRAPAEEDVAANDIFLHIVPVASTAERSAQQY